jgi:Ca-activated chloride channel homolog
MVSRVGVAGIVIALCGSTLLCRAGAPVLMGKVMMDDGSVPARTVAIERFCGEKAEHIAATNAKGEFIWRVTVSPGLMATNNFATTVGGMIGSSIAHAPCVIRAALAGYESNVIDFEDANSFINPVLPTLILSRRGTQLSFETFSGSVPHSASADWNRADKSIRKRDWPEAERQLRAALTAAPKFAVGWEMLGDLLQLTHKPVDAQEAYRNALAINPHLIPAYLMLARLEMAAHDWEATEKTAAGLLQADTKRQYPEAYVFQAIARYQLKDLDSAGTSAEEAIRQDKKHDVPLAEYVYGLILEARHAYPEAKQHISRFLELDPNAAEAASARTRIANLGKTEATQTIEVGAELAAVAISIQLGRPSQAWVPGGIAVLGSVAHLEGKPASQDFFAEYCRTIAGDGSTGNAPIPQYAAILGAFMTTITTLTRMGEHHGDSTTIQLSLATPEEQDRANRILQLVGWKIVKAGSTVHVEPGDQPADSPKQPILQALGVDPITMQQTLQAGHAFSFEIASGEARLIGGGAWMDVLKDPSIPGGIAGAFASDIRLSQTYAALSSMSSEAATALVAGIGLRELVTRYSMTAFHVADAFQVSDNSVVMPGGKESEPAWQKLTGAKPHDPPAFLKALLLKDQGRLATFYWVMAHADTARQKFFLQHAEKFYTWYRDSGDFQAGMGQQHRGWRVSLFRDLPLDNNGNIAFPGGRRAWSDSSAADAEILLKLDAPEALLAVARLEKNRKAPLDEASAKLLARHYAEWRALFPLFERLPELTGDDFAALEKFGDATKRLLQPQQNLVVADWHALVELMMRGRDAGTVIVPRAFRDICTGLAVADPSSRSIQLLREMAGDGDLDQVVPARFLGLTGDRLATFERVIALQKVPRISSAKSGAETAAALTGLVYAASFDPDGLLVNEDPQLLAKHQFATTGLFAAPALVRSSEAPGSHITGGLIDFVAFAGKLTPGGKSITSNFAAAPVIHSGTAEAPVDAESGGPATETVFRADSRLVEVYATVTDSAGHYVDDLPQDGFTILDQGKEPKIVGYESRSSEVSVALLLDTTGSMMEALPALKNAALRLIDDLRPADSVAVYSFNSAVEELQSFTHDKDPAKRAVLQTLAYGETALYDALTRVGRDLAGRSGKKVIVLFTDGDDNLSTLTADIAVRRAKAAGVPVYTVALGASKMHPEFVKRLATISKTTGAQSFVVYDPHEIHNVFDKISEDLAHGYLLVFQPESTEDASWRSIQVGLRGVKGGKVRAREGYYPQ